MEYCGGCCGGGGVRGGGGTGNAGGLDDFQEAKISQNLLLLPLKLSLYSMWCALLL